MDALAFHGTSERFIRDWRGDTQILRELLRDSHNDLARLALAPAGTWLLRHSSFNKALDTYQGYSLKIVYGSMIVVDRFLAISYVMPDGEVKHKLIVKTIDGRFIHGSGEWEDRVLKLRLFRPYDSIEAVVKKIGLSMNMQLPVENPRSVDYTTGED